LKDALGSFSGKIARSFGAGSNASEADVDNRKKAQKMALEVEELHASVTQTIQQLRQFSVFCLDHYQGAESQLFQDLFVQFTLKQKRNGYFVEFGATNGRSLSNTYLLEKKFGWNGVLAEPARCWHGELAANRACKIDHRCVWSRSGEQLSFNEARSPEFSTIDAFSGRDMHAAARADGARYMVETVSLLDLLDSCGAPRSIDYMSVDTEGSELEILRGFDFGKYDIRIITVEHNGVEPDRSQIFELLSGLGYERRLTALSNFDDWYVRT
jgi:FkbM family methyltransferase